MSKFCALTTKLHVCKGWRVSYGQAKDFSVDFFQCSPHILLAANASGSPDISSSSYYATHSLKAFKKPPQEQCWWFATPPKSPGFTSRGCYKLTAVTSPRCAGGSCSIGISLRLGAIKICSNILTVTLIAQHVVLGIACMHFEVKKSRWQLSFVNMRLLCL